MRCLKAALFLPVVIPAAALPPTNQERDVTNGHAISGTQFDAKAIPTCIPEDAVTELEYLRSQLRELQHLIVQKKRSISSQRNQFEADSSGGADDSVQEQSSGQDRPACRQKSYLDNSRNETLSLPVCRYASPEQSSSIGYTRPMYPNLPSSSGSVGREILLSISSLFLGFSLSFLFTALHRRFRTPGKCARRAERRTERQARPLERQHSRAARHAALKERVNSFLDRLKWKKLAETCEIDEMKAPLIEENEDSISNTTMSDEISEFRNAADMVSGLIAAEEGRSRRALRPISESGGSESSSMLGDEDLPAYEYHGSDISSVVADGFRGDERSPEYTPSQAGSADDILGPRAKPS